MVHFKTSNYLTQLKKEAGKVTTGRKGILKMVGKLSWCMIFLQNIFSLKSFTVLSYEKND